MCGGRCGYQATKSRHAEEPILLVFSLKDLSHLKMTLFGYLVFVTATRASSGSSGMASLGHVDITINHEERRFDPVPPGRDRFNRGHQFSI